VNPLSEISQPHAVRPRQSRRSGEQVCQQMEREPGLDHLEGRSRCGFRRSACLLILAYDLLPLEQVRTKRSRARPGKSENARPLITLPAIRRSLPFFLTPISPNDTTYRRVAVSERSPTPVNQSTLRASADPLDPRRGATAPTQRDAPDPAHSNPAAVIDPLVLRPPEKSSFFWLGILEVDFLYDCLIRT